MSGAEAFAVLGVISSIISIVDGTKKVYDAATNPQGLPEAFREIAGRLTIIGTILRSTKQNIEDGKVNNDSCKGAKHIVEACEEKAQKLKELFDKVIPADGASDLKRYYKAVKAWGKGSAVESLMTGMLEDIQLLACERGMKTATKAQQEQITKAITDVSAVSPSVPEHEFQKTGFTNTNYGSGTQYNARGENIAQGNARQYNTAGGSMSFVTYNDNRTQDISNSLERKRNEANCLEALFLTNPRDDRAQLINDKGSRVDGTCQWIKSHALYKSWFRSHDQLLWLSGGPGKGKTMLSIFLAEELEGTAISQNKLVLQYFCDNKDEKRNTAVAVLRGLIYQLLQSRPKLFDHILPDFKTQKTSLFSFETLWRIFERMVFDPALETTNCVLDGLDECDEASLEVLLRKFAALFSATTNESSAFHLNLLVVSRDVPYFIPDILSGFPRISLDPDADAEIERDIRLFIKAKVQELSGHRLYPDTIRVYVEKVFQERAQGTFLWIGIVARALRKYKATEVIEALDLFPPGLDEVYARILLQIDSGRREIAARILRWVVMAVRPLTLPELSFAIEPNVESSIVPIDRDRRIRDQISYCGDFLVIKEDQEDQEGGMRWVTVGLIHQSAKDYLLRKRRDSNPKLEAFRVKEDVANLEIARRCLDYLQSGALENSKPDVLSDKEQLSRFPLLSYAVLHWHEHARFLDCSEEIFDLSSPFYHKKSQFRKSWLEAYWYSDIVLVYEYREPPKSIQLLHFASFFGILPLAKNLVLGEGWINSIKRLSFLNKTDSHKMTALMWAVRRGHEAVAQLLLEKGADIEIKAQETVLTLAAKRGHEAIVHLLLEKGAKINAKGRYGDTALIKAAESGHEAIVHVLLEKGAKINAKGRYGDTALIKVAESGHEAIVHLLLEKKVDINVQGMNGYTAMMTAVRHDQEAIVQLLLKKGADPNFKTKYGQRALVQAARFGFEDMTRLLLENGADIHSKNKGGATALIEAVRYDGKLHEALIRLLLEKGADINAKDEMGHTALMVALSGNFMSREIMRLILEQGADTNAKSVCRKTALIEAMSEDSTAAIRLLLKNGADVNAEDRNGETALAIAIGRRADAENEGPFYFQGNESQRKQFFEVEKRILDSMIQILTLHSQTQSSI